ncbi:hypothetical protein ACWERY_02305 [Streptomyces sp. NPDC004082]
MTDTTAADRLVAEARRAVHESLAALPAWDADHVRSLIADLETAVEGRTAIRAAAPLSAVSVGQLARILHETAVATTLGEDGPDWDQLTEQAIDRYRMMAGLVIERLPLAAPPPAAYQADLRDRVAAAIWARTPEAEPSRNGLVMGNPHGIADAVLAALPAPTDRAAIEAAVLRKAAHEYATLADQNEAYDREQGDLDEEARVRHATVRDVAVGLRRMADEAQQGAGTTADRAAAAGLTDTEYRARSHTAAVAAVRASIPGMYAHVAYRLEDVLNEADEAQQPGAHRPARGDAVEAWLKAQRDQFGWRGANDRLLYDALDGVLDRYRLHADSGTPLGKHVCEGQAVGDCECMGQPAAASQPAPEPTP